MPVAHWSLSTVNRWWLCTSTISVLLHLSHLPSEAWFVNVFVYPHVSFLLCWQHVRTVTDGTAWMDASNISLCNVGLKLRLLVSTLRSSCASADWGTVLRTAVVTIFRRVGDSEVHGRDQTTFISSFSDQERVPITNSCQASWTTCVGGCEEPTWVLSLLVDAHCFMSSLNS